MADLSPVIETMEHRWMRAWVSGDTAALKALTSRNFRMVMGSKPSAILDYKSWIEAAPKRFQCRSYRFGDIYVVGATESDDFPVVAAFQPTRGGGADAFLAKVAEDGSGLVFSTYLGGAADDRATAVAVTSGGVEAK